RRERGAGYRVGHPRKPRCARAERPRRRRVSRDGPPRARKRRGDLPRIRRHAQQGRRARRPGARRRRLCGLRGAGAQPPRGGGIFSRCGLWPALSASGAVGFTASVDRGAAEVAAFVSGATGPVRLGAVGDALPGGGTLSSFGLYPVLALSSSGGATFATAPTATGEGVEGIFFAPPAALTR